MTDKFFFDECVHPVPSGSVPLFPGGTAKVAYLEA